MFQVFNGRGFQVTFENGFKVSVMFGPQNYCENRDYSVLAVESKEANPFSENAEIAIFEPNDDFINLGNDDVAGFVSPNVVGEVMECVRKIALPYNKGQVSFNLQRIIFPKKN